MHFDSDVKTNIKQMILGILILGGISALGFFLFGYLNLSSILGIVIGCIIAFLNFFLLAYTLQKALNSGKNGKALAGVSYTGRILLQMVLAILAIVILKVNPLSVLLPLIFPRLVILFLQVTKKAVPKGGDTDGHSDSGC